MRKHQLKAAEQWLRLEGRSPTEVATCPNAPHVESMTCGKLPESLQTAQTLRNSSAPKMRRSTITPVRAISFGRKKRSLERGEGGCGISGFRQIIMKATLEVVNLMEAEGVIGKYAIAGAVGATFYLEPSATLDIDIIVALPKAQGSSLITLRPIYDYLASHGYKAEKEYVVIEGWPVQFLPPSSALEEEALQEATETEVEGVCTRVISAEHLAAMALKTSRAKDFARILQFVESGVLDADRLDQILKRHGLLEKWEQFGARFLRDSQ